MNRILFLAALSVAVLPSQASISNTSQHNVVDKYVKTVPVVSELTQVVYYRERTGHAQSQTSNIYVDGQYHTSLLPGHYTLFCLAPGHHIIGINQKANTLYKGTMRKIWRADFVGGKTYFVRISEDGNYQPQPEQRAIAEKSLLKSQRQSNILSRASAVTDCVFDPEREQTPHNYAIASELLFGQQAFGNSQITQTGRAALAELALTIRNELSRINVVTIVSGTGARVMPQVTDRVKLQRAEAIRSNLIENAIPAQFIQITPSAEITTRSARCVAAGTELEECDSLSQPLFVFAK